MQLGHDNGRCPFPALKSTNFEILDLSGQHTISVYFCGCFGALHEHVQLLWTEWFPASISQPNSAFTFDMLDTFQLINLQGKLSAYNFYQSLIHKTDNLGILPCVDEKSMGTGPRVSSLAISCFLFLTMACRIAMSNSYPLFEYGTTSKC